MAIMSKFAERLSELMSDANLNADALGKAIGVDDETVRLWKNGDRNIFLAQMLKLAKHFNCSLDFLAGRTESLIDYIPKNCPPFCERLRAVMEERGKTRYRMVKETAIYDGYFTNWKNGSDPHILTLILLADYIGVSIDYLVGRDR